jgi:hypothetical protein
MTHGNALNKHKNKHFHKTWINFMQNRRRVPLRPPKLGRRTRKQIQDATLDALKENEKVAPTKTAQEKARKTRKKIISTQTKLDMTQKFTGITNILQGINKRSRGMEKNNTEIRKFDDLYSLFSNTSLLVQAYGNIRANKGSMTAGINSETVDEISLQKIMKISEDLKNHKFKFKRLRRKWVEKPKLYKKGEKRKQRPLSVPTFTDRLVQEAIRMILEAIYEFVFEKFNANFGFRPKKGCHHSIAYLKEQGTGCNTAIEGDVEGAYDNVVHEKLIKILSKRIQDQKFLDLLNQGFKCGILDNWLPVDTFSGRGEA